MPPLTSLPIQATLALMLGLSLPQPLQANPTTVQSSGNPAAAQGKQQESNNGATSGPGPAPSEPTAGGNPEQRPLPDPRRSPEPPWGPPLESPAAQGQDQQPRGFELLKPPGSLLEILALAALPLAILALALAVIQTQRSRRDQAAIRQRLKELRQELSNRPMNAPAQPAPRPPVEQQQAPVALTAEAATRWQTAIEQAISLPPTLQQPQALPVPEAPLPPAPAPKPPTIDDWISALNAGQRDNLRGHAAAQLNITKDSEDAIQMGRSDATCLEEVAAGGSYLQVSCGPEHWLLPTERTLASFRSFQPIKGLFTYQTMASGEPQVLQACRLESTSRGWRVVAPGVIRVAG